MPTNYAKTSADVIDALERATSIPQPELAAVSSAQGAACTEINNRLQRASGWIAKGMHAEAIAECEREPNILDAVALLDIPDRENWLLLHDVFDMVVPPTVRLDLAAQLNHAYSENAPLETLLQKHRLLALGRGSISSRLLVLREIAIRDPDSETWNADVEVMEQARLGELKDSLASKVTRTSVVELNSIREELSADWRVKVPDQMFDSVHKYLNLATKKADAASARKITSALLKAHDQQDENAGRDARSDWEQLQHRVQLEPNTVEQVDTALDWLAELDEREMADAQFAALERKLELALDAPESPRSTLADLHTRLRTSGFEIREDLRQRYTDRISQLDLRQRRTHQLKILAVVGVVVVLALGVWQAVLWRQQRTRIAEAASLIREQFENDSISSAVTTFESLPGDLKNDAAVEKEFAPVRDLIDRKTSLQREAESILKTIGTTVELADETQVQRLIEVSAELDELRTVPPIESDIRPQIEAVTAEFNSIRSTQEVADTDLLLSGLKELEATGDEQDSVSQLRDTKQRALKLGREFPRAGTEATNYLDAFLARVDTKIEEAQRSQQQAGERRAVTQSIGRGWEEYSRALATYAKQTNQRIDAELTVTWKLAVDWAEAISALPNRKLVDLSPSEAENASQVIAGLRAQQTKLPVPSFEVELNHIEAAAKRVDLIDAIETQIQFFQNTPKYTRLFCLDDTQNESRYYFSNAAPGKQLPKLGIFNGLQLVKFEPIQVQRINFPLNLYPRKGAFDAAPHVSLVNDIVTLLRKAALKPSEWDRSYVQIIKLLLDAKRYRMRPNGTLESGSEPLVVFLLLKNAWDSSKEGSAIIPKLGPQWDQRFRLANVNLTANWLLNDAKVNDNRNADKALRSFREHFRKQEVENRALWIRLNRPPSKLRWIGWMTGEPTAPVEYFDAPRDRQRLFVASVEGGQMQLNPFSGPGQAQSTLPVGTPVFTSSSE